MNKTSMQVGADFEFLNTRGETVLDLVETCPSARASAENVASLEISRTEKLNDQYVNVLTNLNECFYIS